MVEKLIILLQIKYKAFQSAVLKYIGFLNYFLTELQTILLKIFQNQFALYKGLKLIFIADKRAKRHARLSSIYA